MNAYTRTLTKKDKIELAICEALGLEAERTTRIILDFDPREPRVLVYAQMIGDSRLLNVDWAAGLTGATVEILDDRRAEA